MRVVFLGTPAFAVPSLEALNARVTVVAVVTQPDRERDRKGNVKIGAVRACAEALGLPVYAFERLSRDGVDEIKRLKPDLMVTCAYGQLLSQEVLDIAPLGVLNVHGSLLPAYRGSAPIQRALMDGKKQTGVTIMKTDIGMDSGGIVSVAPFDIQESVYVDELFDALSVLGAELLTNSLEGYVSGTLKPIAQDESKVTYAPRLTRADEFIDFALPAVVLRNRMRGVGFGVCEAGGLPLKILRAEVIDGSGAAGEILSFDRKNGFVVACGTDALKITTLQPFGKKAMGAADFINGMKNMSPGRLSNGR